MDLAIAIRIGSPSSTLPLVRQTIESIQKNIGTTSFRFIISLDPKIDPAVKEYVRAQERVNKERFELLKEETLYWSLFINEAIERAGDCAYFIKAHDDVILHTHNFFPKVVETLSRLEEPVGWISFDDIAYFKGFWSAPTRPGFHKDFLFENAWDRRKMFQFHTLPENWWKRNRFFYDTFFFYHKCARRLPLLSPLPAPSFSMSEEMKKKRDMPSAPVRAHAPWNMFVMVAMKTLQDIGLCEHWQTYNALMVDEDWGLRALQKRYWNIWIPDIQYEHCRIGVAGGGNRSQEQISKDSARVFGLFEKKWKFYDPRNPQTIHIIKTLYSNTHIPWSIDRNSFEWDYAR